MMSKGWMTFILVFGALTGTFIGTKVVSDMHKAYTAQLEDTVKTLEADLVATQLQLGAIKAQMQSMQKLNGHWTDIGAKLASDWCALRCGIRPPYPLEKE